MFVHRCGRTARIGHSGQALLFLLENEEPFVDFLKIHQQVVLEQWACDWTLASLVDRIRKMAVRDRLVCCALLDHLVCYSDVCVSVEMCTRRATMLLCPSSNLMERMNVI